MNSGTTFEVGGVRVTLAQPDTHASHWIDYNNYVRQLEAAWLRLTMSCL